MHVEGPEKKQPRKTTKTLVYLGKVVLNSKNEFQN